MIDEDDDIRDESPIDKHSNDPSTRDVDFRAISESEDTDNDDVQDISPYELETGALSKKLFHTRRLPMPVPASYQNPNGHLGKAISSKQRLVASTASRTRCSNARQPPIARQVKSTALAKASKGLLLIPLNRIPRIRVDRNVAMSRIRSKESFLKRTSPVQICVSSRSTLLGPSQVAHRDFMNSESCPQPLEKNDQVARWLNKVAAVRPNHCSLLEKNVFSNSYERAVYTETLNKSNNQNKTQAQLLRSLRLEYYVYNILRNRSDSSKLSTEQGDLNKAINAVEPSGSSTFHEHSDPLNGKLSASSLRSLCSRTSLVEPMWMDQTADHHKHQKTDDAEDSLSNSSKESFHTARSDLQSPSASPPPKIQASVLSDQTSCQNISSPAKVKLPLAKRIKLLHNYSIP